jgi:hypothetical protein
MFEVLQKGYLQSFLGTQGRADLAAVAGIAARAADPERGLDDFLGRLPATALVPAHLRVEPAMIDLGTMRPGEDRRCELLLHNDGMRLLYGSAVCEGRSWLTLGEGAPQKRKLFQFSHQAVLPVRVWGPHLRAYHKPQQAEIRLESSGGTVTVTVRVQVPVVPFAEGALAGAQSPRQLAEKARAQPREAAALIESGAVASWYASNGWTYPVPGPTASGMAAVQQLLETLGLTKAPQVELSEDAIRLQGLPGERVEYVLAVVSQENRAAVAHGLSDQPWLQIGPTISRGRSAFLPLTIPSVPDQPRARLHAHITVFANGGQRFRVPLTLSVTPATPVSAAPFRPMSRRTSWSATALRRRNRPHARRLVLEALLAGALLLVAGLLLALAWILFTAGGEPPPKKGSQKPSALSSLAFLDHARQPHWANRRASHLDR